MWKERDNTGLSCLKINVKCHSDTVRSDKAPPPGRTFLPTNCEKTQIDVTHTQTSSDNSFPWKPKCSLEELLIEAWNYRQEEEDLVCITVACVAGVLKGNGKGVLGKGVLGARETRGAREEGGRKTPFPSLLPSSRAPRVSLANSLSLPFQTPATQASITGASWAKRGERGILRFAIVSRFAQNTAFASLS